MSNSWERLRKILIERGKERGFKSELARSLKVTPNTVQRFFSKNETSVPGLDLLDRIADALNVPAWELIKPEGAVPTPAPESPTVSALTKVIDNQAKVIEDQENRIKELEAKVKAKSLVDQKDMHVSQREELIERILTATPKALMMARQAMISSDAMDKKREKQAELEELEELEKEAKKPKKRA